MKAATFALSAFASIVLLNTPIAKASSFYDELVVGSSDSSSVYKYGDTWWFDVTPYSPYGPVYAQASHNLSKVSDTLWVQTSYGYNFATNTWQPFIRYLEVVETGALHYRLRDVYNPVLEFELHLSSIHQYSEVSVHYSISIWYGGELEGVITGANYFTG